MGERLVESPISRKGSKAGSPNVGLSPGARSDPTARSRGDQGPVPEQGERHKSVDQQLGGNSDKPPEV
jgi:hypothetical protein